MIIYSLFKNFSVSSWKYFYNIDTHIYTLIVEILNEKDKRIKINNLD